MTSTSEAMTTLTPTSLENLQDRRHRIFITIIGIAALSFATSCLLSVTSERMKDNSFKRRVYTRVGFWIRSSESTVKNGTFLTLLNDKGQIIPIEEQDYTDDLGHALISNILAYVTKAPVNLQTLMKVNLVVNTIGLMMLSLMFLHCRFVIPAIMILLAGAWVGIPYMDFTPDNQGVCLGVYCLALVLPVFLVSKRVPLFSRWFDIPFFILGLLCLTAACFLRQPIGIIGVFVSIVLLINLAIREKPKKLAWALKYFAVSIAFIGVYSFHNGLLSLRNCLFNLRPSSQVATHGIAHNLYLGLGTEPNPWGIAWNDSVGRKAVQNIDPKIVFGSEEYFSRIKSLYLSILWNYPREVLSIYTTKFAKILAFRTPWLPGTLSIYLVLIPIFTGVLTFLLHSLPHFKSRLLLSGVLFSFSILFLLQGVLAFPHMQYMGPVFFGVLINIIVLLCFPLP